MSKNKPPVTQDTKRKRMERLRREQKLMAEGIEAYVGNLEVNESTGELVEDRKDAEWIEKLPEKMSQCGKQATFRPCAVGHVNQVWVKCCDCPICIWAQAKRSAKHLITVRRCIEVADSPVYAVLTCQHSAEDNLTDLVETLYEGLKRLKKAFKRKRFAHLDITGVLVKHEVTTGGLHGFHPHINLLLNSAPLYQEQVEPRTEGPFWKYLREEWAKIMAKLGRNSAAPGQYCGRLKSEGEIAKYLAKGDVLLYQRDSSKEDGIKRDSEGNPVPHEPYERGRIILEVAKAYRNRRTIQGSGIFFNLRPSDEEAQEDSLVADFDNGEDRETCHIAGCSEKLKGRIVKGFHEVMDELAQHGHLKVKLKKSALQKRSEAERKKREPPS